jgi:sugar lactone lactonase YvrE
MNKPRITSVWVLAAIAVAGVCALRVGAQSGAEPTNSLPNPYRAGEVWAKLPAGRVMGSTNTLTIDGGGHVWVFERCGANSCADSTVAPILEFDASGKLMKSFGSGMFVFPHGIFVDKDRNVWVADAMGANGKGQQVTKLSPDGKVLMKLGKAGVAGTGPDTFNQPSAVVVARDGSIFVADGHGGDSNARIVKFSKDGTFVKAWGKKGDGPGDFNEPHSIALDSKGRLFVADRANNRIQIFDQDGKLLMEWKQFGRPSGIYIDKSDTIYVADSESDAARNPGWKRGIRVGSAKDGKVTAFIPDTDSDPAHANSSGAEGIVADGQGNVYGAEVGPKDVKKYIRD